MDEIILKYLENNLTADEEQQLAEWLADDPVNQQVLYQIEVHWLHDYESILAAKSRVSNQISSRLGAGKAQQKKGKAISLWSWAKIAAILVLGTSLGMLVWSQLEPEQTTLAQVKYLEKVSLPGQKVSIVLPDGTKVKLNAGSKLIAPEQFTGEERKVELIGEAYFDVTPDKDHPFIICTRDVGVRVLGTAFNVRSYPAEDEVKVAVAHGKVSVHAKETNEGMVLLPNEMAIYNLKSKESVKTGFDFKSVFAWKDKTLYFNEDNISDIIATLENWYGVKFKVNIELDKKRDFSGEYHNKSLQTVLDGLSYVYGFKYEIQDDSITLN